jgi:hypothetical protein
MRFPCQNKDLHSYLREVFQKYLYQFVFPDFLLTFVSFRTGQLGFASDVRGTSLRLFLVGVAEIFFKPAVICHGQHLNGDLTRVYSGMSLILAVTIQTKIRSSKLHIP